MRKSFVVIGFCLIATWSSLSQAAENDLFSQVRTESVFQPAGTDSSGTPAPRTTAITDLEVKITSTGELARKLRGAGFDVEEDSDNRMVSTKTTLSQWTFPVLIVLSEDNSQLTMAMLLSSATSEDQIPKAKLLELLQANRQYAPSSFGYSAKRTRMELYHVVKNQLITSGKLRDEIARLAAIAAETEQLWDFSSASGKTASTESASSPGDSPSLTGKWVASRSASEAFAIQFNTDGTFRLVYVNQGKQTQSTGSFKIVGENLSLDGSGGFRLTGTISSQSDKEFQFLPENSAAGTANLVFARTN